MSSGNFQMANSNLLSLKFSQSQSDFLGNEGYQSGVLKWHLTKEITDVRRIKKGSLVKNCLKIGLKKYPFGIANDSRKGTKTKEMYFTGFKSADINSSFEKKLK